MNEIEIIAVETFYNGPLYNGKFVLTDKYSGTGIKSNINLYLKEFGFKNENLND